MQVARDDGLNNAFWLYTPFNHNNSVDILEIDITEAHFHDHNHTNLHDWRPTHVGSGATHTVADIDPGYHRVGLEWTTSGELRWFWNGALMRTIQASSLAFRNLLPAHWTSRSATEILISMVSPKHLALWCLMTETF